MTNGNFLRTGPSAPRIPIDEAVFPPLEAPALTLALL
jgi:hypothetical protein